MDELSYANALDQGIEPIHYRTGYLQELGEGHHEGWLDALVWCKRIAGLQALITLDIEVKVAVIGFKKSGRRDVPEYLGFRAFRPGQRIVLVIDTGVRGGLRPTLIAEEETP